MVDICSSICSVCCFGWYRREDRGARDRFYNCYCYQSRNNGRTLRSLRSRVEKTDLSGIDAKALGFIALAGLFGAMSWMAYFKALSLGEASRVIPVDRSSVLFAVILAWLILGERVNLKTGIGVILITIGTILVSL